VSEDRIMQGGELDISGDLPVVEKPIVGESAPKGPKTFDDAPYTLYQHFLDFLENAHSSKDITRELEGGRYFYAFSTPPKNLRGNE